MKMKRLKHFSLVAGLGLAFTFLNTSELIGQDTNWQGTAGNSALDHPGNWSTGLVPYIGNGGNNTGVFNGGFLTPSMTNAAISPLEFQIGANSYTFNLFGSGITFSQSGVPTAGGIVNTPGFSQVFNANNLSDIGFTGAAKVNSLLVSLNAINSFIQFANDNPTDNLATFSIDPTSQVAFDLFSTSSTSTIATSGNVLYKGNASASLSTLTLGDSGSLQFVNGSPTAATSAITMNNTSTLSFGVAASSDTATAASSTIILNDTATMLLQANCTAGSSNITLNAGTTGTFGDSGTAASSTITVFNTAALQFQLQSTAGTANITNSGALTFGDTSTAGSSIITSDSGSTATFQNTSTAGSSAITLNTGSTATFVNNTTAGTSVITSLGGSLSFGTIGGTDTSSAGSSTITISDTAPLAFNANTTAGSSLITLNNGTTGTFGDASTAGTSTISCLGGSSLTFGTASANDTSSAGSSTITVNNAPIAFNANTTAGSSNITLDFSTGFFGDASTAGTSTILCGGGSSLTFGTASGFDTSSAGSSTITVNNAPIAFNANTTAGSSHISLNFSTGTFGDFSTAGTATINMNASDVTFGTTASTGTCVANLVNASQISFSGVQTFGALAADGTSNITFLDNTDVSLNSNNASTTIACPFTIGAGSVFNINKVGTGTLTLTGNNIAFGGTTAVNAGNLKVNGSLGGIVSVNNGGILSGTGTLNDIIVNSGGTMAPGNSIGTMVVNGTYAQNAGSFYNVQINEAGQSTLTNVTGTAILAGGTVQVTPIGSITTPQEYTILHSAGGVTGQFSGVTFASNFFVSSLVYDLNDVFLKLTLNKTPFSPIAATQNQATVALQLETLFNDTPDPAQQAFLNTLFPLTVPELENVLDLLSGEQYTSMLEIGRLANRRFLRQLYNPLRYDLAYGDPCECDCSCDCKESEAEIWTDFEGGRAFFEGNENASGFSAYNYDASLGIQKRLCSDWLVGAAAGYEYDHLKYDLAGHGRVHTAQGAVYAAFKQPEYYAFSDLVGGWSDFKVVRPIQYRTNNMTAFGNTHLYHATLYTETGLNFYWNCLLIQPFAGVDVSYYRFNGVKERGTGVVDLNIRGKSIVDTDTYLGTHFLTTLPQDFIWSTDLAWVHRFFNRDHLIDVSFQGFGDEFSILGINEGQNCFEGAVSIARTFCDSFTVYAEFSGEVWSHFTNYEGTLGLLAEW